MRKTLSLIMQFCLLFVSFSFLSNCIRSATLGTNIYQATQAQVFVTRHPATFTPSATIDILFTQYPYQQIIASDGQFTPTNIVPELEESKHTPTEQTILQIPLDGPISKPEAEISGLAWYKEYLILLPQYPSRFGRNNEGVVFAIPKVDIINYLDGNSDKGIKPIEIAFFTSSLEQQLKGFEGFEALAFQENRVFLTIEAKPDLMLGYLISGIISPDLTSIQLDTTNMIEIHPQTDVANMSDESIMVFGNRLVTIYEANGSKLNSKPVAHLFNFGLLPMDNIAFPNLEYRLTDTTSPDSYGRFWAINYFFPGDTELNTSVDPLTEQYAEGETHSKYNTVERLIELRYTEDGIVLSNTEPIQLKLIDDQNSRNWEGIVRLDNRGFLLATDKYPETILAFVSQN